jgi:ABC-type multidrug transport system permease subunit
VFEEALVVLVTSAQFVLVTPLASWCVLAIAGAAEASMAAIAVAVTILFISFFLTNC